MKKNCTTISHLLVLAARWKLLSVFQMLPFQLLKTCCPHVIEAGNNRFWIFLFLDLSLSVQGRVGATDFFFWKIIIGSVRIAFEFVCCWHIRHLLTRKILCNKFLWSQMEGRRPSHWVLTILHTQNLKIFLQVKVLQVLGRVYEFCTCGCHFWLGWRYKGRPMWWVFLN